MLYALSCEYTYLSPFLLVNSKVTFFPISDLRITNLLVIKFDIVNWFLLIIIIISYIIIIYLTSFLHCIKVDILFSDYFVVNSIAHSLSTSY